MIDSCDLDELILLIDIQMVEYITSKIDPENKDIRILSL
jgi:hypothetical protein